MRSPGGRIDYLVCDEAKLHSPEQIEALCRQHHRRRLTASWARAVSMIGEPLPFS